VPYTARLQQLPRPIEEGVGRELDGRDILKGEQSAPLDLAKVVVGLNSIWRLREHLVQMRGDSRIGELRLTFRSLHRSMKSRVS
jgi:hypothetical protein